MSPRPTLVALAAGGTGGHVFPAQALAVELAGRGHKLAVITDKRGDALVSGLTNVDTYRIRASGFVGRRFAERVMSASALAFGTLQARSVLKRIRPDAVVGFGGYASVPTMLAASFSGFPTALHEQNAVLGRANRLLASRVDRIATSFVKSRGISDEVAGKVIRTGMPIRSVVAQARTAPYQPVMASQPIQILVLGGSQGAQVFGDVVPQALALLPDALRQRIVIAQQCRPESIDAVRAAYRAIPLDATLATFFSDVTERLATAQLVITRSGASTVAELTTVGRPAILVPYPHAIDGHQAANADALSEAGAGWTIPQDSFTPEALAARIESLVGLPIMLERAAACARAVGRPDAAIRLADVVCELLPNGKSTNLGREAA